MSYVRENLSPVKNPHPDPPPQPRRQHPYDVEIAAEGKKVYVGLQGSELEPGSEVAVYDVAKDKVVRRIRLKPPGEPGPAGSSPYRLTMHPAGRFLLVTNRFSNFATVIDTRTDAVVSEVPTDFYCQGVAFDKQGRTAYVANRYLDQVFVIDVHDADRRFHASMRELGGLDDKAFFGQGGRASGRSKTVAALARVRLNTGTSRVLANAATIDSETPSSIHQMLVRNCGTSGCHDETRGGFVAGADPLESLLSTIAHVRPGDSAGSRLLRAVVSTANGGYADLLPKHKSHAAGTVVFKAPRRDPDFRAIADWIDAAAEGPGIPVGNPRSKPKICTITTNGRYLLVGNTGTQDISILDVETGREVGGIYLQNVVNDMQIYRSPDTGHDYLLVTTEGIGFGVARERDPYGGESWDRGNPAAQFSVWRDLDTARVLPKDRQEVLGPFDAVDGTSEIKFRDVQNDIVMVDLDALDIPDRPPADGLSYVLLANRYESHRHWVRYTSDTAESTYGDTPSAERSWHIPRCSPRTGTLPASTATTWIPATGVPGASARSWGRSTCRPTARKASSSSAGP